MTTILIVDDHPLVADGIKTMLLDVEYVSILDSCKTGTEALQFLFTQEPDIILLDMSLPDINGLELCSRIRKQYKKVKIIGLTSTNETSIITGFLQRGGNSYLLKNMERAELLEAIDQTLAGKIYLSIAASEKVIADFQNVQNVEQNIPIITRREKEIIQLLAEGLTGPQISEKLFLSHHTVETHRKNLFKKFNVSNVMILINVCRQHKILS